MNNVKRVSDQPFTYVSLRVANLPECLIRCLLVNMPFLERCHKYTNAPYDSHVHVKRDTPSGDLVHEQQVCVNVIRIGDGLAFAQIQACDTLKNRYAPLVGYANNFYVLSLWYLVVLLGEVRVRREFPKHRIGDDDFIE